jgi:hypothetical protein
MFFSSLLVTLKVFVSIVFLFAGICKLTPALHPPTFYELEEKFRGPYQVVLAGLYQQILKGQEYNINPIAMKRSLGILEISSIVMMWTGSGYLSGMFMQSLLFINQT